MKLGSLYFSGGGIFLKNFTFILQFKISNMDNVYLILNWFHGKYLDDTLPSLNIYLKYRRIINTKQT